MAEYMINTSEDNCPDLDKILECPLCFNRLKSPRTLRKCLHSFCQGCIEAVPKHSVDNKLGWICPKCKNFSGEAEIRKAAFITDLIDINGESLSKKLDDLTCEQCLASDVAVYWKCDECKINLCKNCQSAHLRIPLLKGHRIVPINTETLNVVDRLIFCKHHETNPVMYNCKVCETLICIMCRIAEHCTHDTESESEALHRLLPEMERNNAQLGRNTNILEAQLKAIVEKIENINQTYALCKIEMKNKFEQMINALKDFQSKMEDEIVANEAAALSKLGDIKEKLENQLSQGNLLTDLVRACISKARNISLLNEVQGGLFDKVKQHGGHKIQSIEYDIPELQLKETRVVLDQFTEMVRNMNVTIIETNSYVVTDDGGVHDVDKYSFMCDNFQDVFSRSLKKDFEVEVSGTWRNRISYIGDQVWVPSSREHEIQVYTKEGQLKQVLKTDNISVMVLKEAANGDVIAGGLSGLYVTNKHLSSWELLIDGNFRDLVIQGRKFSALHMEGPSVLTYEFKWKDDSKTLKTWQKVECFKIDHPDFSPDMDSNSTMLLSKDGRHYFIASPSNDKCYKFTSQGNCVDVMTTGHIFLCGSDKAGNLLTVNYSSGHMYTSSEDMQCSSDVKQVGNGLTLSFPRHIVIDSEKNVWALEATESQGKKTYKLVKYSATKKQ